jgi:alpha-glucoside transport system substrate-binding protein
MSGIRKRVVLAGGMAVAMTLLTGCLQNPNPTGGEGGGAGLGGFVDGGSADGDKKVVISGNFAGAEQKNFEAALVAFEKSSGIDIEYTGDADFATTIKQKVNSGDSPDIAFFPQPGGLLEFAAQGKLQPIDTYLNYDELDATLIPGLLDSGRYKGRVYAAPMRLAAKSFVWYPKEAYTAGGYDTEPKSIQELHAVAEKIKADGVTPWCMGWENAQATGWVGTDWVEELVLRMWGPDVYDDWTSHRIPFNDERIVKSLDEFAKIAKDPTMVLGGPKGVLSTAFGKAALPSFASPPKCFFERQGNFVTSFYPKEITDDLENKVGIFVYPPFEGGFGGQPMLGGADLAALFNGNDDDAKKVMEFLSSDKFGAEWAKVGGWLSPHRSFDASNYPDEITRQVAKFAGGADVFRFDGSDVMPKAVGSGTFWTEMVKWENGQSSQETADNIEASWPKS